MCKTQREEGKGDSVAYSQSGRGAKKTCGRKEGQRDRGAEWQSGRVAEAGCSGISHTHSHKHTNRSKPSGVVHGLYSL